MRLECKPDGLCLIIGRISCDWLKEDGSRLVVTVAWDGPARSPTPSRSTCQITVNDAKTNRVIDRKIVNGALGTTDGAIASAGDLAKALNAAIAAGASGVIVSGSGLGSLESQADEIVHKEAGSKAIIAVGAATDSAGGGGPIFDIPEVDVPATRRHRYVRQRGRCDLWKMTAAGAQAVHGQASRFDFQRDRQAGGCEHGGSLRPSGCLSDAAAARDPSHGRTVRPPACSFKKSEVRS